MLNKTLVILALLLVFLLGFDLGRDKPLKRFQFLSSKKTSEKDIPKPLLDPKLAINISNKIDPEKDFPIEKNKNLVIVIASYNNQKWVKRNIDSVIEQNYDNYRVVYIDDNSTDNTYKIAKGLIENSNLKEKFSLIRNKKRMLAMHNLYQAVHKCRDDEIIVSLDGDDWFAHPNVLAKINQVYQNKDVWLTYGQNIVYPQYIEKQAFKFDREVLKQMGYRHHRWATPQLRTFYAGLFKKIDSKDLMLNDSFLEAGCDIGYMFPMLEMSGGRYRFIEDVLYIYNQDHLFNDHKIHQQKLISTWNYIKSLPPYEQLDRAPY